MGVGEQDVAWEEFVRVHRDVPGALPASWADFKEWWSREWPRSPAYAAYREAAGVREGGGGRAVIEKIVYRDAEGRVVHSERMIFKRLWAVGQTFVINYVTLEVLAVEVEGDTQYVTVRRCGD